MPSLDANVLKLKAEAELRQFKRHRRISLLTDDEIRQRLNIFDRNCFEFLLAKIQNYRFLNNEVANQASLIIEEVL